MTPGFAALSHAAHLHRRSSPTIHTTISLLSRYGQWPPKGELAVFEDEENKGAKPIEGSTRALDHREAIENAESLIMELPFSCWVASDLLRRTENGILWKIVFLFHE